jgi:pilus assembly protein CpaF
MGSLVGAGLGNAMGVIDRVIGEIAEGQVPFRRAEVTAEARRLLSTASPTHAADWATSVTDRILGLGPLQGLLADPAITDILVNGPDEVWVDRGGELSRVDCAFGGEGDMYALIERLIAPLGLRIDRSLPMVDARLADGSRIHAVVPPAAVDHPFIAIRRFTQAVRSLDELVESGGATAEQAADLGAAVAARQTVLVSGGTGSGKTTLLNVLAGLIPPTERVVTIEDAAELQIPGHRVRLEAHPANSEGVGELTVRQLLRSALRLRPDRIIIGEVRGEEAMDLIWALNTGHRGSMSTVHANSPEEAMWRLETLALSAGETSPVAVQRQLAAAIDIVVQLERIGSRRRIAAMARVGTEGVDTP